MRVFLGTLWSSIKQIKVPYVFAWEPRIALHAMQGNQASSIAKGEVSWVSSSSCAEFGVPLYLRRVSQESLELPKVRQATYLV